MPSPVLARDDHRVRLALAQPGEHQRVGDVGLVDHDQLGHLVGADLGEHLAHGGELALGVGVRAVDDVQDQVGVGDLLQRRAERLDELVRQVPDEADGVAHRVDPAVARSCVRRVVGSRVANSASSTSTPAPVSRLSSEDLPALV